MGNCDNLAANVVVESVDTVGVDEAVSNPEAGLDGLCDLTQHVKGILNSILGYLNGTFISDCFVLFYDKSLFYSYVISICGR